MLSSGFNRHAGWGTPLRLARWTSEFRHERRELVGALSPAFMEAHLLVHLPVGNIPVLHAGGIPRLPPSSSNVRINVMNGFSDGSQALV
jgi:hypothetical protein